MADTTRGFDRLPKDLREVARIDANGEVSWPRADALRAIEALTTAGCVVLGLDLRSYDSNGAVLDLAWTDFQPSIADTNSSESSRAAAVEGLRRADAVGFHDLDWVLVTWNSGD